MMKLPIFNFQFSKQRGQIALVILLMMMGMLALGVTVVQRGIGDVKISEQEEETLRAFQAAETGVEEALRTLTGNSGNIGDIANYNTAINPEGQGEAGFNVDEAVEPGEAVSVDLTGTTGLTAIRVLFASEDGNCGAAVAPAIEVMLVSSSGTVSRQALDPDNTRRGNNKFDPPVTFGSDFLGTTYCWRSGNVAVAAGTVEARLRPYYASSLIGVEPQPAGATLAGQYTLIRSTGTAGGQTTRMVEVKQMKASLPTIFDYVLFTEGTVNK